MNEKRKALCKQSLLAFVCGYIICFSLLFPQTSLATHAAGAELTYTHISGNDYRVTATFYRDCGGVAEPSSIIIKYRSASLGFSSTIVAIKDTSSGQEITVNCSSVTSTCNGGSSPGIRKFVYLATVSLPQNAADWIFSFYVCCRNCSITTIATPCASNSLIYVEATLNNLAVAENNSPVFSNLPVPFICIGQNFTYNNGVVDADGDSLAYELVTPKINDSTNVTFIAPNSATTPIQTSTPFTLNAITGSLNFTPAQQQIGIFAFKVSEYRNGVLIGSVIRDMQVYTIPCINNLPSASGINATTNYSAVACANTSNCFTIQTTDNDSTQSLVVTSTLAQTIPGATITVSSGVRPLITICWTPSVADIRTLPYNFTITVRDNACPGNGTQTFTYAISVRGPQVNITTTSAACSGGNGGTATANTINSGPCTYLWNTVPVQTTSIATNLIAGNYNVTVTDTSGCSVSQPAVVAQASIINIAANVTQIGCSGQSNASIALNVSGGVAPYSYQWSNGAVSSVITSLSAGTYSVTVTDNNGCYQNQPFTISQPQPLIQAVVNASSTVLCNANATANINLNVTGGTLPLAYNWSNGSTSQNLMNVHSGSYSCTITDANGCTANSAPVVILQPTVTLSSSVIQVQNVSCTNLSSGSVAISVNGGMAPYTYVWSNGSSTQNLNNLIAGTYLLTVTDDMGCVASSSATVQGPAVFLKVSGTSKNINCNGSTTGEINATANGGIPPYTYAWANGLTTPSLTQLPAGSYKVNVTDNYGCTDDTMFVITQPDSVLSIAISVTPVSCNGNNTATATALVMGGTSPYTFQWSNGSTTTAINNLPAGTYAVTVKDAAGCESNQSVLITASPNALTANLNSTDANCLQGIAAQLQLNVNGGTAPYTYAWSNGMTTSSLQNISAGIYSVIVTDVNGCTFNIGKEIRDISVLSVMANGPTEFCVGGFVKLSTSLMESATYQWYQDGQTLTGAVSSSFTTPATGAYTVAVTNTCGTFISNAINVKVNSIGNYYVSPNVIICPSEGETTTLAAYGGSYYKWDPGFGLSDSNIASPVASPMVTTKYTVSITSNEGCSVTGEVTVTVVCDSLFVPSGFSPDDNSVNDLFVIKGIRKYPGNNLFIYNRWGNLVYKKKNYNNNWDGTCNVSGLNIGQQLPNGTYFYILDLNDGKKPVQGYITLKR